MKSIKQQQAQSTYRDPTIGRGAGDSRALGLIAGGKALLSRRSRSRLARSPLALALTLGLAFALSPGVSYAAVDLGDAAIIGIQSVASPADEFSIVFFKDVPSGEQFYFADIQFSTPTTVVAEDPFQVTLNSNVSAGSVLTFSDTGSTWATPGHTVTFVSTGFYSDGSQGASVSAGDNLLLFDSTDGALTLGASTHLFYIKATEGAAPPGGIPTGLSLGNGAVNKGGLFNFRYKGSEVHAGTASTLFAAVSDVSKWEDYTATAAAGESSTGPFAVAVPGPAPTVTTFNVPDVTEVGIGATSYTFDVM